MLIKANKQKNIELCCKSRHCLLVWPYRHERVMKKSIHQKNTKVCLEVMAYFQKEQDSILLLVEHIQVGGRSLGGQALLICEERLVYTPSPLHSNNPFFLFSFEIASTQTPTHSLLYHLICLFFFFGHIFHLKESYSKCQRIYRLAMQHGRENI